MTSKNCDIRLDEGLTTKLDDIKISKGLKRRNDTMAILITEAWDNLQSRRAKQ